MAVSLRKRHKLWFRTVSVIVLCLFLVNDMSYGIQLIGDVPGTHTLSVPSGFNGISLNSSKDSLTQPESSTLTEALRGEAGLVYVSHLMGKVLSGWGSVMSEKPLKTLIERHLSENGKTGIKWEVLRKEGKTFCLPYIRKDGSEAELRFYDPKDAPEEVAGKESIAIGSRDARLVIETKAAGEKNETIMVPEVKPGKEYPVKDRRDIAGGQKEKILIDAVFEGGGAKGVAYVGALEVLVEKNIWFRQVAGTSAGAIVASLIAAGYDSEEIKKIVFETDFNSFKDRRWGFLPGWLNLLVFGGLYRGLFFEKWISEKLKDKLGYEPTLKDLPIPLTVIASDIADEEMLILNAETSPDLKVSEAVRMSMGIPFFFNVFHWFGKYKGRAQKRRVVDGGLLSNFPLFVLEEDGEEGVPVVGFRLHEIESKSKKKTFLSKVLIWLEKIPTIHILIKVLSTGIDAHDKRHIEDDTWARIVDIPVTVGTIDFDLTEAQKEEQEESGRKTTEKMLDKVLEKAEKIRSKRVSAYKSARKAKNADKETPEIESVSDLQNEEYIPDPDEQKVQDLIDGLVLMAVEADAQNKKVLLGIDTGLIPEVQMQTSAMNNLLKVLRTMRLKNVIVCQAEGAALYGQIAGVREEFDISKYNIVIVGEKEILSSGAFDALKAENEEEVGAYFAEVIVPEGFPDDGDTGFISIVAQAIQEASKYGKDLRRKEFLLKAEPMGIDKLVDKLERQTERFAA